MILISFYNYELSLLSIKLLIYIYLLFPFLNHNYIWWMLQNDDHKINNDYYSISTCAQVLISKKLLSQYHYALNSPIFSPL